MQYLYASHQDDMILRDHLAYDRTKFALIRTFLSIARTALGLYATGLGLIILQTSASLIVLGWIIMLAATVVLILGSIYSWRARGRLDGLGKKVVRGTSSRQRLK